MSNLICRSFRTTIDESLPDDEFDKVWNIKVDYIKNLVSKYSLTLGQQDALFGLMSDGQTKSITASKTEHLKEVLTLEGYECSIEHQ